MFKPFIPRCQSSRFTLPVPSKSNIETRPMQNERSGFFELTAPVLSGAPFAWGAILGADDENIPFIPPSPRATPAELGAGEPFKQAVRPR